MIAPCGRADLARALVRGGEGGMATMARLLGLEAARTAPSIAKPPVTTLEVEAAAPEPAAPVTTDVMARLAPVRFWQVTSFRSFETSPERHEPAEERPIEPLTERDLGRRHADAPALSPLLAWPQLWRHLRRMLVTSHERAELDVERFIELLCRGEAFTRMPRQRFAGLASQVWLVVDRSRRLVPFWSDQDELVARLTRLLGELGVTVWTLPTGPGAELTGPAVLSRRTVPPAGTPVLALTDLGAYAGAAASARWIRWGRRLAADYPLYALLPCPEYRWSRTAAELWNAHLWDRGARTAVPDELSAAVEERRAERLLRLLSPAIRVEPELLRAVRHLLPADDADAGTEADAWSHAGVQGASSVAFCFDGASGKRWRGQWSSEPRALRARVVDCIRRWHRCLPDEIGHEEAVSLAELDPDIVAEERLHDARSFFERVALALQAGAAPKGLSPWFGRLSGRLPDTAWSRSVAGPALRRAWVEVSGDSDAKAPPGIEPHSLERSNAQAPRRSWELIQDGPHLHSRAFTTTRSVGRDGDGSPLGIVDGRNEIAFHRADALSSAERLALGSDGGRRRYGEVEAFLLSTDVGCWRVDAITKPAWASAVGRDEFGLWIEFEVGEVVSRLRWIPPGQFTMGSPPGEAGRYDDERQHEVVLTRGYWLGETPVTQSQWQAVMGEDPSRFPSLDRPVDNVSWDDAQRFLDALRKRDDALRFRLPTEAEWERACRAGTVTGSYAGNVVIKGANNAPVLDEIAWYGGNSGVHYDLEEYEDSSGWREKQHEHSRAGTRLVKGKKANGFGLYDMLGNVWEWCADRYYDYPTDTVIDPVGPKSGSRRVLRGGSIRVLRGGSWHGIARRVRSACRQPPHPSGRYSLCGFRVARGQELQDSQAAEPPRKGERAAELGAGRAGDVASRHETR